METTSRFLDPERGQLGRRRRHVPQISISDESHHVTEAIGDMYGDSDWPKKDTTAPPKYPSSLSPREGRFDHSKSYFDSGSSTIPYDTDKMLHTSEGDAQTSKRISGEGRRRNSSMGSNHSAQSPPLLTRTNSDTSSQHFPLNDIDYESSPAAVAQELSNLQAIRRMSMNVEAADPDLPSLGPTFSIPTAAPSHNADEDDEARMFWVPARLHPELAPKEFKTFVEDRVERIQRRSHEASDASSDSLERSGSSSNINRRKSMLSRTIDSGVGYQDGADVLERKRSRSSQTGLDFPETSLQEMGQTLNDPVELARKISIDSSRRSLEAGSEAGADGDVPILPVAPGGQALKRSTRTNYRRGSLRKGERVAPSRRATLKGRDADDDQLAPKPSPHDTPERPSVSEDRQLGLTRVSTEPTPTSTDQSPDNFSRPSRRGRPIPQPPSFPSVDEQSSLEPSAQPIEPISANRNPRSFVSRLASNSRTTAHFPTQSESRIIPQIIEPSPGPPADQRHSAPPQSAPQSVQHPERKSSHDYGRQAYSPQPSPMSQPQMKTSRRPNKTLDDMANSPWMMPGQSTNTDALTFIPSFTEDREERKPEKKSKERKDSESGSRKPSWGWLLGGQSQDPEDKKDKREEKELSKKSKIKTKQPAEKPHDSTRLDLLNTASDKSRSRESLVLDRDSIKLDEERRKESSTRRTAGTEQKTGASGIFSTLFGGKKKASDRDAKKGDTHRRLSPEPPPRHLRADIDYNWTRFSILEERAIYRMAHLKLANPRRALHSQVLLSNFMYSYLAKVQQMHPSIQIPAFVQKQQKSPPAEQQEQSQQSDEFSAWQRYQEQQHEQEKPAAESSDGSAFIEDYDPGHQQEQDSRRQEQQQRHPGQRYANNRDNHGQQFQGQRSDHYAEQGSFDGGRPPEDDEDLW